MDDNMISLINDPREYTNRQLELISDFSKVVEYNVKTQLHFLTISKEQLELKILNLIYSTTENYANDLV